MKRLFINGSPRGKESNSRIILSWIAEGMASCGVTEEIETIDLARLGELDAEIKAFLAADEIVMVMPLYTDSMPALVKRFIDSLVAVSQADLNGKRIAFVVQSGFPEGIQGETLGLYLSRLSQRCGWKNMGVVVKGGIEGIQIMPPGMTEKTRKLFMQMGASIVNKGIVEPTIIQKAVKPYTLGFGMRLLFTILKPTGLTNMYWNMNLKKNNAWEKRFDAPYGKPYKR